jgi:predicted secreted protein
MRLARLSRPALVAALLFGLVRGGLLIAQDGASDADREKKTRMIQSMLRGDQTSDLHQAQLTLANSGQSRTVALGYPIFVRLAGNPANGYQWRLDHIEGEAVRQDGKPVYYPREGDAGVAGSYVFKFMAVKQGKSKLRLVYQRPGQKREINHFTATIVVSTRPVGTDAKTTDVHAKDSPSKSR